MKRILYEAFHSLALRLPQRIALRNGMRITTYGTKSNSLFWSMFTSPEYLSFIPYLLRLKIAPTVCLDCGAALGYFSLLIEHLRRSGVLPWKTLQYTLVEPMPYNFDKLKFNVVGNIDNSKLLMGVVGKKTGDETFFYNSHIPWGGSLHSKSALTKTQLVEYIDISSNLKIGPCLLKLDIEGAEFDFIDNYQKDMHNVLAIIIEWHLEYGNRENGIKTLTLIGFAPVHQSLNKNNRIVELFVKKDQYI